MRIQRRVIDSININKKNDYRANRLNIDINNYNYYKKGKL